MSHRPRSGPTATRWTNWLCNASTVDFRLSVEAVIERFQRSYFIYLYGEHADKWRCKRITLSPKTLLQHLPYLLEDAVGQSESNIDPLRHQRGPTHFQGLVRQSFHPSPYIGTVSQSVMFCGPHQG